MIIANPFTNGITFVLLLLLLRTRCVLARTNEKITLNFSLLSCELRKIIEFKCNNISDDNLTGKV